MCELSEPVSTVGVDEEVQSMQVETSLAAPFKPSLQRAVQMTPTQRMSEMANWVVKETTNRTTILKPIQVVLQKSSDVQSLWEHFHPGTDKQGCRQTGQVVFSNLPPVANDLLGELMMHLQTLLAASITSFSYAQQTYLLQEAYKIGSEEGLAELGKLLFLIDRQPEQLMQSLSKPDFSKQDLHLIIQERGEKALRKAIGESIAQDASSSLCLSDRIAKTAADLLITRVGFCNIGLLELMPSLLSKAYLAEDSLSAPSIAYLRQRLKFLIDLPQLRQQLYTLKLSENQAIADSCIRATWQLPEGISLSCMQARKTLLAAFFSHVRQLSGEEDCFASALIISVMEESPIQAMEELRTLLMQGGIKRFVGEKEVFFPWVQTKGKQDRILPLQRAWRQVIASMSEAPGQGICAKRLLASTMPIFQQSKIETPDLQQDLQVLFSDYFRWIYDPQVSKTGLHRGGFCLYRALGNEWKKVDNEKEFVEALEAFIIEKWPDISMREEKRRLLHAKLMTDGLFLEFVNDYRARFDVKQASKGVDLSQLHCTPWLTNMRGNTANVWHIYYQEKEASLGESQFIIPTTGEQLIEMLVNFLQTQKKGHLRQIVRVEDVHAFTLLNSQLIQLPTIPSDLKEWIEKNLKSPSLLLSSQIPSEQMRQKLMQLVLQICILPSKRDQAEKAMQALSSGLTLSDLRSKLISIAVAGQKPPIAIQEMLENKIDDWIIQLLSSKQRRLIQSHALLIGDSNWSDEAGTNRYLYLGMHPVTGKLTFFLGDLYQPSKGGGHFSLAPLNWLGTRWQFFNASFG